SPACLPHGCSLLLLFFTLPRPRISPLFPYTTLFRSCPPSGCWCPLWCAAGCLASPAWCWACPPSRCCTPWYVTGPTAACGGRARSEEHTSELQSRFDLVCRLLLEKKKAHPPPVRGST